MRIFEQAQLTVVPSGPDSLQVNKRCLERIP